MPPTAFGKYVVTEVLGSGGMAEVYAGVHPDLGRKVAIKVILPQFATERDFEERFRREARVVASLRHAHIVQLYDFDVVDGRHFMVMEYLDGGTLKEHLRALHQQKARMSLPEIADLIAAMAGALDYAHGRGAIHRDIKPANILFTAEGEPVLTDFGIAKLLEDAAHLTATGGVVGSPFYMPPEQATGGAVDARSDQYALGVALYEMATGRVPFQGNSAVAVMTQHLNSAPPPPRTVNAALPVAVETVLLKALAKRPAERFGSVGELAQAFRQAVNGQSGAAVFALPTDENARTVLSDGGAAPADAMDAAPADAPTVVPAGSQAALSAEDATTRMATAPAKPTTQHFNVGGIQAGIVNQGGEQTFTGDLTFNLDFGDIKAASPQPQAPTVAAAAGSGDAPQRAPLRDVWPRAWPGAARPHRLARLVTQFHAQLEALPAERATDRNQVVKRVQALLLEVSEAKPDPDMVEIMGASLARAVQPLSGVDPELPTLVTHITSWVEALVQPE